MAAKKAPPKKKDVMGPPAPAPKKSSADARAFGAHTAIFVPPELQHEAGPKPKPVPPKSVVVKVPKRTESTSEKRKRLAAETAARERLRVGLHIKSATGANDTRAVPDYHPPPKGLLGHRKLLGLDVWDPRPAYDVATAINKGLQQEGHHLIHDVAPKKLKNWGEDLAAAPGETLRALLSQSQGSGPRTPIPIPRSAYKASEVLGKTEPVFRPLKETSETLAKEDTQQQIWGNSLVNLVAHGDTPGSGMEAAGLGVGILGILPFGKITQLAKLGRAARAAGKIGEALPMTPAREATYKALAVKYGEEVADNVILATDNIARQTAASKAKEAADIVEPDDWYKKNPITSESFQGFKPTGQEVRYQTGAGARKGLVEGRTVQEDSPFVPVNKKAAFKEVNAEGFIHFIDGAGDAVSAEKTGPGQFLFTNAHTDEEFEAGLEEARQIIYAGQDHHRYAPSFDLASATSSEVPVFKPGLPPLVAKQPTKTIHVAGEQVEVFSAPKEQLAKTLENALAKPGEWSDTGMEAFFDGYPSGANIPTADMQRHFASSLNAYDVDEVIYRSDSGAQIPARFGGPPSPTQWQGYEKGGLLVRDPTPEEPYVELYMKLRTPIRTKTRRGVMGSREEDAAYRGKGELHWNDEDVIGHVRMHIVIDADGKRALVIDEIQSDWASQWNALKRYANMAPDDAGTVMERAEFQLDDMKDSMREAQEHLTLLNEEPGRYAEEIADTEEQIRNLDSMIEDLTKLLEDVPGPPPLASKQMEAIVRRTLRFAQESGVDRIIVVQGDVQAVRNQAYTITPKGREIQFHDNPNWVADKAKWIEDTKGMTQAEIQAFARDPAHADSPMVKAFLDLYGSGDEAGKVQKIFEKEMGVKGSTRKGIFEGGYADEARAITRQPPEDDFVIDGVKYMEDPAYPEPKRGDRVMTVEGPGIVQGAYQNGEVGVDIGRRMVVKPAHYVQVIIPDPSAPPVKAATHMMDGYVIEMTDGAKAKAAAPMAYYQQRAWEQIPKGATEFFADGTRAIRLFEDADISTVLHELAHVGLEDMSEVDRAIILRNFNGLKTTADHEMYARSFERYIYEGHPMNSALDGVFGKLKTWMQGVYQHVNDIGGVVNPEVKAVFDRMVVQQESPGEQLVRLLKTAPGMLKEQDAITSEARAVKIGAAMDVWKKNADSGADGFYAALHELRGEIDRLPFAALEELSPEAMDSLLKSIVESGGVRGYEKVRAADAILRAKEGVLPTRSELALLNKIFGGTVGFKHVRRGRADRWFTEIFNFPRALAASWDASAPFRQALVASTRHPVIVGRAIKPMIKTLAPTKGGARVADDIGEDIALRDNSINGFYRRAKLAVDTHNTNVATGAATMANTEEPYASYLTDKIPGIKHSARAYETFLHKVRADIFDSLVEGARIRNAKRAAEGKSVSDIESDEFLQGLGRHVNGITGRGTLSRYHLLPLEQVSDGLNVLFFSPRLLASRVNMLSPVYYAKLWRSDPAHYAFWKQVQATSSTVVTGLAVLGAVSVIPGVTVGTDPTSANFGKIRIGDTRIDIFAGFNPVVVLAARLFAGYSTSSSSGNRQDLKGGFGESSPYDIVQRFFESKFAPTPGLLRDFGKKQDFLGKPVNIKDPASWWHEAKNNLPPMMLRDALNVYREPENASEGIFAGIMVVLLGGLGVGFNSYPDKAAKSKGGGSSGGSKGGSLLDDLPSSPSGSMLDDLPSDQGGSMLDDLPSSSGESLLGP